MFSTITKDYTHEDAEIMFLITPRDTLLVLSVDYHALLRSYTNTVTVPVRPTINLTSTVVIKSGSGTEWDPFVVGLPS